MKLPTQHRTFAPDLFEESKFLFEAPFILTSRMLKGNQQTVNPTTTATIILTICKKMKTISDTRNPEMRFR